MATADVAGAGRDTEVFIGSSNGLFINSYLSYARVEGVSAASAESFTVTYSNPDGANPANRTFTGPQSFSQIFNQIRNDIGSSSGWSATGTPGDGVISVTRNVIGPINGVWEVTIPESVGGDVIGHSGFTVRTEGENPRASGESVTLTFDDPINNSEYTSTVTAGSSNLDASAIAAEVRTDLIPQLTSSTPWSVSGSGRDIVFTRRARANVGDIWTMSSSNSALVPTVSSLQSRIEGYPANGQGATTFTATTPEGNTLPPFTLTNTTTGDWDSVAIANQIRSTLSSVPIPGWTIEDTSADNTSRKIRFISDTNREVGGLWTISPSNSNGASTSGDVSFLVEQEGGPARTAQTYTITINNDGGTAISSPITITGPVANSEVGQAIVARNPTVTGFTVSADDAGRLILTNNVVGATSNLNAAIPTESSTGSLATTNVVTVVTAESVVTNAERVLTVTDDRGVDHSITIYGSKSNAASATFVNNNLTIPGWASAVSNNVITYTADDRGPRSAFTAAITGSGGGSTLAVTRGRTAGTAPTYVAPFPDVSATPRPGDIYRGERIVDSSEAVSTEFSDYTPFIRIVGEDGEDADPMSPHQVNTITLFRTSVIEPVVPNSLGFDTGTGDAVGDVLWSVTPAIPVAGQRIWSATREIILRGGETTWTRNSRWFVNPVASSGTNGSDGTNGEGTSGARFASHTLYTSSTLVSVPSEPVAAISWDSGDLTISGSLWAEEPPTVTSSSQGRIYTSTVIFYDPTGTAGSTSATGSAPRSSFNLTGAVSFIGGDFALDGSTITTINGGNIATGSVTAEQIAADYAYIGELNADRIIAGTIDVERLPGLTVGDSLPLTDMQITAGVHTLTPSFEGVRAGTRFLLFGEIRGTTESLPVTGQQDLLLEFTPTGTNVEFDITATTSTLNAGRLQRFAGLSVAPAFTSLITGTVLDDSGTLGFNLRSASATARVTGAIGFLIARR